MRAKFTIKQIFQDHWDAFLDTQPQIRPVVVTEVEKMLHCGDPANGYHLYYCHDCKRFRYVAFRCKSRFCPTCGAGYQADRADSISAKFINCKHRHIVFTIPDVLRNHFRLYRHLLHLLFQAAANTVLSWFTSQNKQESFTPGIVCCLHTFGRDLKWNPHIHMLVSEGACGKKTPWKPFSFFSYSALRKRWQTILLALLENSFGKDSFRPLKSSLYLKYEDGFYVHARPSKLNSPALLTAYITRYIGRPPLAQSRISNYDGRTVSFWYQRHEDGKRVDVHLPALQFLSKLIMHVPESGFHMLRYYGLYAKRHPASDKLVHFLSAAAVMSRKFCRKWAFRIELAFHYDPTKCSCGAYMEYLGKFLPGDVAFAPP